MGQTCFQRRELLDRYVFLLVNCTVLVLRMAHRKWKESKQQPSMLSGPAEPGSCLVSFHILWAILSTSTVQSTSKRLYLGCAIPPTGWGDLMQPTKTFILGTL